MNTPLIKKFNWALLILPLLIFSLGFVTLFSTAPELATNQLVFFILGTLFYFLFAFMDYTLFSYIWKILYGATIGLLLLVFIIGQTLFGSARWLSIGSFNFQPSEFAKLVIVIGLSAILFQNKDILKSVKGLFKIFLLVAVFFILVVIQPDLGTSLIIFFVSISVLWFAGLNKVYYLLGFILVGILSAPLWNLLKTYQQERVLVFLNPGLDTLGSGYNVIQSTIAIGSGQLLGRGFGQGTQSHLKFLPVYWTDFIFASFAEEWGFIGTFGLIGLYTLLLFSLLYVAIKVEDSFGSLIAIGFFVIFFFQFAINIGMNLGLMPVTGVPLPLVSYGGSSLLTSMMMLGILQSVWIHQKV